MVTGSGNICKICNIYLPERVRVPVSVPSFSSTHKTKHQSSGFRFFAIHFFCGIKDGTDHVLFVLRGKGVGVIKRVHRQWCADSAGRKIPLGLFFVARSVFFKYIVRVWGRFTVRRSTQEA